MLRPPHQLPDGAHLGVRRRARHRDARIVTLCAACRPAYHRGMHHVFLDESGDHSLAHIDAGYRLSSTLPPRGCRGTG